MISIQAHKAELHLSMSRDKIPYMLLGNLHGKPKTQVKNNLRALNSTPSSIVTLMGTVDRILKSGSAERTTNR